VDNGNYKERAGLSKLLTATVHVRWVSWKSWNTMIHYEHTLETQMRYQNKGPPRTLHYPRTEHPVLGLFIYSPHTHILDNGGWNAKSA